MAAVWESEGSTDMNSRNPILACVLILAIVAPGVLPAAARADVQITPELRQGKIESTGVVQPGQSVERGQARILIEAPADRVLEVLQNYGAYKDFLPNFEASRVLSQRGAAALVFVQVKIMKGAAHIWAELKLKPRKTEGP